PGIRSRRGRRFACRDFPLAADSGWSRSIGVIIETMDGRGLLAAGHDALARGEWAAARASFLASWEAEESPDALDGLGRALWWLDDPASALEVRGRAFGLLRRDNRDAEAAAVAIWIARQYR